MNRILFCPVLFALSRVCEMWKWVKNFIRVNKIGNRVECHRKRRSKWMTNCCPHFIQFIKLCKYDKNFVALILGSTQFPLCQLSIQLLSIITSFHCINFPQSGRQRRRQNSMWTVESTLWTIEMTWNERFPISDIFVIICGMNIYRVISVFLPPKISHKLISLIEKMSKAIFSWWYAIQ